ncbi:DJ-1 family glyoxalase III [Oribacterium sp. WCC10]|uniref:DJ-1 family glyoxalase III n=1 Tax=Oribacterium sp. WCC10 TaxID=1855343 RepID=UPI0008E1690D|nr:DJ-1 family glyoxalase III [Oribacterium sp. WCC10]SFG51258.1 4-methyl-5(b-hydroxyethyl)-thiazole monophosphate biosynthesis [Oribacterium sp. WCC10]
MKVFAFIADGSEEVECLAVIDVLKRAQFDVTLVAVKEEKLVHTAHAIDIIADTTISDINVSDADILFLPGGGQGTQNFKDSKELADMLLAHAAKEKPIAAICAAPSVLGTLGLLKDRKATCFPGFEEQLIGARHVRDGVVTDGNITTARGVGYALDLGLRLVSLYKSPEYAKQLKAAIQYDQF